MKKVKIHYLFSKNNKIGSRAISFCTRKLTDVPHDQVPSHVAILVNNRWVYESTFDSGIRVISYEKWLQINQEVYKVKSPKEFEYKEIKNKFKEVKAKKYDWLGAIYFGLHIIKNSIFKTPIPEKNKWASKDRYFCSEVLGHLLDEDFSMESPVQIMEDTVEYEKNSI